MTRRWTAVIVALVFALQAAAAPTAEEIKKGEQAVADKIKELKGGQGLMPTRHVGDGSLDKLFAGQLFFAAHIRQYPVAIAPVEGSKIKSQNLFAVKDGKVEHLTEVKQLEKIFQSLPAAKDEAAKKEVARAWAAVAPEFRQDGFYKFQINADALKVDGNQATSQVIVMQGGAGMITYTLAFDDPGKVKEVKEDAKVREGPRPICQATKLLDADSIVRKMAERDLLIMGKPAHGYLMEQRAQASPELQAAIDRLWQRIAKEE